MVKVSVIIPVYNAQDYLNECIDSVLDQSFSDFEVICVNDGSTDNSLDILNEYDDGRITIISKENGGLASSRNAGLDISKGEYILFLDADDYITQNCLEKLYDIANSKSLDCVFFKLINFNYKTKREVCTDYFDMKIVKDAVGDNIFNWRDIKSQIFDVSVTAPAKLFKKELIGDIRFPEGLIFEDNLFFVKILFKAERLFLYDEYLYYRRRHPKSITKSYFQKFSDTVTIFDLITEFFKEIGYYEEFKIDLFNNQCETIFLRFSQTSQEFKQDFFNKIKANFSNRKHELGRHNIFNECEERSSVIFENAINSNSYLEFELTVNNYDLIKKNKSLKLKNKKYKKQISKLNKLNEKYSLEINNMKNSTSWKVTKVFRDFFNFLRR